MRLNLEREGLGPIAAAARETLRGHKRGTFGAFKPRGRPAHELAHTGEHVAVRGEVVKSDADRRSYQFMRGVQSVELALAEKSAKLPGMKPYGLSGILWGPGLTVMEHTGRPRVVTIGKPGYVCVGMASLLVMLACAADTQTHLI